LISQGPPHSPPQIFRGKRLVNVRATGALEELPHFRVEGVSRREQAAPGQIRISNQELMMNSRPIQARHTDIRDHEVIGFLQNHLKGFLTIGRYIRTVAMPIRGLSGCSWLTTVVPTCQVRRLDAVTAAFPYRSAALCPRSLTAAT